MSDTVEVSLDMDEAYPVYFMQEARDSSPFITRTIEVPREVYDNWKHVIGQHNRVQDEMAAYHCIMLNGEHEYVTTTHIHGPRTYCVHCNTDKEEPLWDEN